MSLSQDAALAAIFDLLRAGQVDAAREACAAALAPGDPGDALLEVAAMLAARANDPAGAAGHLEQLVARQPGNRAARINLARALTALGRFDRAHEICAPLAGDPAADRIIAFAAHQSGDLVRALSLYSAIVAQAPDDADSWANLGNVHAARVELESAVRAYERAIKLRPGDVRLHMNLAGVFEQLDRSDARRQALWSAVRIAPDDPDLLLSLGLAEAAMDDFPAAEAAFRRAIAIAPGSAAAWLELGMLLENSNRLEDLDRLIVEARPQIGAELALLEAWSAFRHKRFDEAQRHADRMPDTLNPIRRYVILGEIADRRGESAAAFAWFERMNAAAIAAAPPPPPGPTYRETVEATAAALRARPPGPRPVVPPDDVPDPVFIVGFPRSGTTLLDTILGHLPNTLVLEEHPIIPSIERRIGGAQNAHLLDGAAIAAHRAAYRAALLSLSPSALNMRIIDKHPLHLGRMSIVNVLFPNALILFVERHPYDVVLSCFMSNFRLNQAMRSFADVQETARTYDAVLRAWTEAQSALVLHVHTVRYERLVADLKQELRPVLDFIKAGQDPTIFDTVAASKQRGRVRTASYAQILEPIYQRSVARWQRYQAGFEIVRPTLAPWADQFGYPT